MTSTERPPEANAFNPLLGCTYSRGPAPSIPAWDSVASHAGVSHARPAALGARNRHTGIRHHARLIIQDGHSQDVDLDSTATSPSWSPALGDRSLDGPALSSTGLDVFNGAKQALLKTDEQATYATCRLHSDQDLWINFSVGLSELDPGSHICIRTTAGRLALVALFGNPTPALLTFDITVWNEA